MLGDGVKNSLEQFSDAFPPQNAEPRHALAESFPLIGPLVA